MERDRIFKLVVSVNNAAFEDHGEAQEVARILREAADRLAGTGCGTMALQDRNGNKVGFARFEG